MTSRFRSEEVAFRRPFRLRGVIAPMPAGRYTVDTEEELIEGLSFEAWRRIGTTLTPAQADRGTIQLFPVQPQELAEAIAADAR